MTETVSPEMVALARRLYADGATLDSILRRTGIKNQPRSIAASTASWMTAPARGWSRCRAGVLA